jgi:hypothetical protein
MEKRRRKHLLPRFLTIPLPSKLFPSISEFLGYY